MQEEIVFLALTIAVEAPIAFAFLRKSPWQLFLLAIVCVNMVTHPIAWYFAMNGASLLLVEVCVTLAESIIFATLFTQSRAKAIGAAVVMNVVSAMIGIIFF